MIATMSVEVTNSPSTLGSIFQRPFSLWWRADWIIDLLAIFAVLAAMVAANVEWLFTRQGGIDTWIYFGFFRHFDVSDFLGWEKKIARLPWILTGFAVNKLASPEVAAFILHFGLLALGAAAFYWLALKRFGREPAILTTLTYITWVPLHGSGGWDYHNTLTPLLYFSSYLALVGAAGAPQRPFAKFFKFGALLALTIHTNILVALVVPALAFQGTHRVLAWFPAERKSLRPWLYGALVGMACGGVSVTCALGLVSVAFGRSFLFFAPLISRSAFLLANPGQERGWWLPWSDQWWTDSFYMAMASAVLVMILVRLAIRFPSWSLRALVASDSACAMAEYVTSVSVFAFGQSLGHPLLQPFYMAMPLAMPMFLALAALIVDVGRVADATDNGAASNEACATALALFAALVFGLEFVGRLSINSELFAWVPRGWRDLPPLLIIVAGYLVAQLVVRLPLQRGILLRSRTLAYGCLAIALAQANALSPIDERTPYDYRSNCTAHRSMLSDIAAGDDVLFPIGSAGKRVVIWAKADDYRGASMQCRIRASDIAIPLVAMGYMELLAPYWTMDTSPIVPDAAIEQLKAANDVLAVVANDDEYVQRLVERLRQNDPRWRIADSYSLGKFDFKFKLRLISANMADLPSR